MSDGPSILLESARTYLARGYAVIPVPARKKIPVLKGWTDLRLSESDLPAHFNGTGNIGVLLGDPKKAPHLFNVISTLMKMYSSARSVFKGKAYADAKRNKVIDQPCVSLLATTAPEHFKHALTPDAMSDGFMARLIVFETGEMPPRVWQPEKDPPQAIVDAATWWGAFNPGGIHQRASGQLYQGKQTHIGWTAREIVLPTVPGSAASGAIIRVAGITGRIRGMKHKRVDGVSVRPSLVLIDDPQTDESARSPSQCANRERILAGAILGMAGPGRKIAGLMTLTVVRPDDLADRILDRDKHPQWQGERTKMVYSFPKNEKLWAEYARVRAEGLRADRGSIDATAFYGKHRTAMDEGAVIAWPERFNHDELSAVQHAMNLRLQNEAAFFAEYQNEPLPEVEVADDLLSADQIAAKVNGHARGLVPLGCSHLTMFVDVQGKALFYLVAAWEDDFTGHIIDYGTEPDQKQAYFTLRDVRRTLGAASPRAGVEGAIYGGLERLIEATVAREWRRDDGAMVRIDRCLIDANWGSSTDVVYQFCRQSPHASVLSGSSDGVCSRETSRRFETRSLLCPTPHHLRIPTKLSATPRRSLPRRPWMVSPLSSIR